MATENETRYFDRRTVQRYIERGTIDEKAYQKYVQGLPDVADQAEKLDLEQPSTLEAPTR